MPSIFDWSTTESSNTAVDGTSIATGMSPGNVDNALRKIMAVARSTFAAALQNFLAGSEPLPVTSGGTGANNGADARTTMGALADMYRDMPVTDKSTSFNSDNSERGGGYNYTGGAATLTLRPNSTHAVNRGAFWVVRNSGTGALTVTRGSGVSLYANGASSSADAVIAVNGEATIKCWATDFYTITGVGVS